MNKIPANWIEQYGQYLREGDIENMVVLKEQYFPQSFFKYRCLTEEFLRCLEEGWLWMSEPFRLNDAFECSLLIDNNKILSDFLTNEKYGRVSLTLSEIQKRSIRESPDPYSAYAGIMQERGIILPLTSEMQAERVHNMWNKDYDERIKHFRICSFSITNESLLMWAHYGQEYKGICIEYDFLDEEYSRPFIHPVLYGTERPRLSSYEELQAIFPQIYASLCKSVDWQYEQEWRYIAFLESQVAGKENKFKVPLPKAIYLGPLFELNDEQLRTALFSFAELRNIPVKKMVIHESEYKVKLK